MSRILSMVQTAGQLSASGKPSEALAMTVDARAAFQKFTNELDEATAQLARVKGPGVTNSWKRVARLNTERRWKPTLPFLSRRCARREFALRNTDRLHFIQPDREEPEAEAEYLDGARSLIGTSSRRMTI
ncbi:MAG: hypothetical protein ACXV4B_07705 [Halobacteriota archaeon]